MKIEIKRRDNAEIIISGEYESVNDCLEKNKDKSFYKANLSSANLHSANLRSADLRSADLRSADLRYVDLSSADLRSANLSSANLSSANLRSADLRYAKTDKRYLQIGCIGSRKDMFIYCFDDDIVWCGCWKGTLKEFEERVKRTHKDNKQFLKEYVGAIKYIRSLK